MKKFRCTICTTDMKSVVFNINLPMFSTAVNFAESVFNSSDVHCVEVSDETNSFELCRGREKPAEE